MKEEDMEYDARKNYQLEKEEVESEFCDFIEYDHQVSREKLKMFEAQIKDKDDTKRGQRGDEEDA